ADCFHTILQVNAVARVLVHAIVASSVLLSPRLSVHVMTTLSPFAPPLNLNDTNGFLATAGPPLPGHTGLPLHLAPISLIIHAALFPWMIHAGMASACAALRWRVFISCLLLAFSSCESPTWLRPIRIGFALSASKTAERDLDFLARRVVLAVGLHERVHVARL